MKLDQRSKVSIGPTLTNDIISLPNDGQIGHAHRKSVKTPSFVNLGF